MLARGVTMELVGDPASDWLGDRTQHNSQSDSGSPTVFYSQLTSFALLAPQSNTLAPQSKMLAHTTSHTLS